MRTKIFTLLMMMILLFTCNSALAISRAELENNKRRYYIRNEKFPYYSDKNSVKLKYESPEYTAIECQEYFILPGSDSIIERGMCYYYDPYFDLEYLKKQNLNESDMLKILKENTGIEGVSLWERKYAFDGTPLTQERHYFVPKDVYSNSVKAKYGKLMHLYSNLYFNKVKGRCFNLIFNS
jgi:hypothetical protein